MREEEPMGNVISLNDRRNKKKEEKVQDREELKEDVKAFFELTADQNRLNKERVEVERLKANKAVLGSYRIKPSHT